MYVVSWSDINQVCVEKGQHGHQWKADISNRIHRGTGCPYCTHQTSRIEIAIYTELSALFENVEWRKKIGGYEIDIYFPDYKIGIELDGYYWHKNKIIKTFKRTVDSHIKLNKPSHEQLNNFAGKLTDRPPCGKAAG
jgi:hypothetical protein